MPALNEEILATLSAAGEVIPESNYWAFATYMMIVPSILKEAHSSFKLPEPAVLGPVWNYLNAACTLVVGINQLTDKTHHRPIVNKLKGAINVASSAQLVALTALGFGGPAFAAAFGVGFGLSIDDTVRAIRRAKDDDYLLKDNMDQLKKVDNNIQSLDGEIHVLNQKIRARSTLLGLGQDEKSLSIKALRYIRDRKVKRKEDYEHTRIKLEKDVYALFVLKKFEKHELIDDDLRDPLVSANVSGGLKIKLRSLNSASRPVNIQSFKDHKAQMNQENRKAIRDALFNNVVWGMAFVGMLLMCIPGMQIPGVAVVAAASVLYLAKNASQIKKKIGGFFSRRAESPDQSILEDEFGSINSAIPPTEDTPLLDNQQGDSELAPF